MRTKFNFYNKEIDEHKWSVLFVCIPKDGFLVSSMPFAGKLNVHYTYHILVVKR